ncbi:MAG: class I SAM-dependent methyltransferase [Planctomycetaceae bacterium]|nr:class I SAM-dependent methyltransferase [Planctomycetaceae bacterium]
MPLLHIVAPLIGLAEAGRLPDAAVRVGIRSLLKTRLTKLKSDSPEQLAENFRTFLNDACAGPVAIVPEKANEQHYEVPAAFFAKALGPNRKYSCCYWPEGCSSLKEAEEHALRLTCEHAELVDGQRILELGCGWGSLSLWMAEHYPQSQITAISNSHSQRAYIEAEAARRGLKNLRIITCDINDFQTSDMFDRVVSVEMFEHVRNHELLMQRISNWLNPAGKLFVHIFCHHRFTYPFEDEGSASWMARYFFSGGIMPSQNLLLNYQKHLTLARQWCWEGQHYEKTSNAWLNRMDASESEITPILKQAYGKDWKLWQSRWRMFFMACAELFGYQNGSEWFVSHYLFDRR